MSPFSTTDTIVAIATPPGRGGIGIVRLSGPAAHDIACALMTRSAPLRPRHATFGRIVAARPIDQIVATHFVAPHSFTGDDVVELSAHGSDVLLREIVDMSIARGARLAEPGEFTLRAYLNGRVDLIQAEAVADLVDAVTPLQARAAMDQLEGTLTAAIGRVDASLFDLAARLEASLDFPEEGFHFVTRDQVAAELARARENLMSLVREGRAGRVVREGRLVVIGGRPNAGKSSLFNALVGAGRAIVTDVAGTTRDLLTERVDIGGLPLTLVDTAGLRDARDAIEAEGIRRAREAQHIAALMLMVIDGSAPLTDDDERWIAEASGSTIVVISKSDVPKAWQREALGAAGERAVEVSVTTSEGLDVLRRRMVEALTTRDEWRDPPAISNTRHIGHVQDALDALETTETSLADGATEELLLAELGAVRQSLEEITGRRAPEELLRHIFSRFCIGK